MWTTFRYPSLRVVDIHFNPLRAGYGDHEFRYPSLRVVDIHSLAPEGCAPPPGDAIACHRCLHPPLNRPCQPCRYTLSWVLPAHHNRLLV